MSNLPQDHTSNRVHAPSGGASNNMFSTSEFEQSAANKKKHMGSDIFGSKKDDVAPAPVKQTRNAGNSIFGTEPEDTSPSAGTLAGQYKKSQMQSNIFGTDEPTSSRHVSDKNKSNIFGIGDNNDPNKRYQGSRQGVRVGYNPINGESYSAKDNVNEKQPESTVKAPTEENVNVQSAENGNANTTENGKAQAAPANTIENGKVQAAPTNTTENTNIQKSDNAAAGNNAQKNVHTSVRVFHPPGGKSNGPLW